MRSPQLHSDWCCVPMNHETLTLPFDASTKRRQVPLLALWAPKKGNTSSYMKHAGNRFVGENAWPGAEWPAAGKMIENIFPEQGQITVRVRRITGRRIKLLELRKHSGCVGSRNR